MPIKKSKLAQVTFSACVGGSFLFSATNSSLLFAIINAGPLSATAGDSHLSDIVGGGLLSAVASFDFLFAVTSKHFLFVLADNNLLSSVSDGASPSNILALLFQLITFSHTLYYLLTFLPALRVRFAILYTKKRLFNKTFIT